MPKAKTSEADENRVIDMYHNMDMSMGEIEKVTGIKKSTVRNIIKRAKESGLIPSDENGTANGTTETHARECSAEPSNGTANGTQKAQQAQEYLTRERATSEVRQFILAVKRRYNEVSEKKGDHEQVWQQTQFLKLYRDGVKMLIECTGLDKVESTALPASPLDDLARAIEAYKEDE